MSQISHFLLYGTNAAGLQPRDDPPAAPERDGKRGNQIAAPDWNDAHKIFPVS
tara:strand:- start:6 stop:164 length:159 start_codon:yes stop_codon:yes gene_type:complete